MQHSLGRFILFLGIELLFVIAGVLTLLPAGLSVQRHRTLRNSILWWVSLGGVVVSISFLCLFVWVLTGEGYLLLFGCLLAVTVVLMLLVELLWLLIGSGSIPWAARVIWGWLRIPATGGRPQ